MEESAQLVNQPIWRYCLVNIDLLHTEVRGVPLFGRCQVAELPTRGVLHALCTTRQCPLFNSSLSVCPAGRICSNLSSHFLVYVSLVTIDARRLRILLKQ